MTSTSQLPTKLCHIIKRSDFEGYGFNLRSEKAKPGQFIGKVDVNSPAEAAGLKEGDRIVEVNGVNISQESHKQVVQRIKAMSNEVRLLIIDVNASKSERSVSAFPANISSDSKDNSDKKELEGVIHDIPGSSTNTSCISRSTKRSSNSDDNVNVNGNLNERNGATRNNANEMLLRKQGDCTFTSSACQVVTPTCVRNVTKSSDIIEAEGCQNGVVKSSSGGLALPMTAAEMRAKLLSKKKYDPKNEIVDLKKKFEIIQKL